MFKTEFKTINDFLDKNCYSAHLFDLVSFSDFKIAVTLSPCLVTLLTNSLMTFSGTRKCLGISEKVTN